MFQFKILQFKKKFLKALKMFQFKMHLHLLMLRLHAHISNFLQLHA